MNPGEDRRLRRELGLFDGLMVNVGTMLGSAIFIVPAAILAASVTPGTALLVWVAAGALSWCGAVTIAELGAMYPEAGGLYVYLERAYHPFVGYLYGWTVFAVIQTASIAAVAVALVTYVGYLVPIGESGTKLGAILLIAGLSLWNCRSVRTSATTQNLSTVAKLAMVAVIVVVCLVMGHEPLDLGARVGSLPAAPTLAGLGMAMVAALWAYDGWISITYVAGEVREPQRFLPRALGLSVLVVTAVYLLVNLGFMAVLPLEQMAGSERVAAEAVERVLGQVGGSLVAVAVIVSCFAAVNGFIFTAARVYFAMAREGAFFRPFARLSRHGTPVVAVLAQGVWASLIALTGSYDQLFTYVIVDEWLFFALAGAAVLVLRRRAPGAERPYRVLGYPVTPLVFSGLALALLVTTIAADPRDAGIGIGILAAGAPLYAIWRRRAVSR